MHDLSSKSTSAYYPLVIFDLQMDKILKTTATPHPNRLFCFLFTKPRCILDFEVSIWISTHDNLARKK